MADETTGEPATRSGPQLTHTQAVNRCRDLSSEIERLAGVDDPSPEEEARFIGATEEFHETDGWRKRLERDAAFAQVRSVVTGELRTATTRFGQPKIKLEKSSGDEYDRDSILEPDSIEQGRFRDPWDLSEMRTFDRDHRSVVSEYRSRAVSAIEKMQGCSDKIRSTATDMVEKWDDDDGRLSRLALSLSEPTYLRAWSKLARSPLGADLNKDEQQAVDRVKTFARAMSLTDAAGGYLVKMAS